MDTLTSLDQKPSTLHFVTTENAEMKGLVAEFEGITTATPIGCPSTP